MKTKNSTKTAAKKLKPAKHDFEQAPFKIKVHSYDKFEIDELDIKILRKMKVDNVLQCVFEYERGFYKFSITTFDKKDFFSGKATYNIKRFPNKLPVVTKRIDNEVVDYRLLTEINEEDAKQVDLIEIFHSKDIFVGNRSVFEQVYPRMKGKDDLKITSWAGRMFGARVHFNGYDFGA